jgi:hypothetical protein
MRQIAMRRSETYPMLIHIEQKLIVRAHMHDKMFGLSRQIDNFAKVQNGGIALRDIRRGNP